MVANTPRIELKIKTGTELAMLVTYRYTLPDGGGGGWRQRRHTHSQMVTITDKTVNITLPLYSLRY